MTSFPMVLSILLPFHLYAIVFCSNGKFLVTQICLPWICTLCEKQDEFPYTLNILDDQAYACSSICTHSIQDSNDSCPLYADLHAEVRSEEHTSELQSP